MLWLYLLGAVTFLIIVLRRVLHRQAPLKDELESKKVVIDHVHSGAAWVGADGMIGSMNPALASTLRVKKDELVGKDWCLLFARREREKVQEAYAEMLLRGISSLDADSERTDGSMARQNVILVAIYDHRMQLSGHHCLTVDRTNEKMLEDRLQELTDALARLTEVPAAAR